ncbi:MAG TPA: HAMP domain-containing sensor histidine kinase, partial [Terriglobia bacterium]|nr:HAMP domain-containing sensor histidine kinase [Terriglobia bacterium]
MKTRVSISAKILLLAFLNVLLLGLVFGLFVRTQYRLDLDSLLLSPGRDRVIATSLMIAFHLQDTDRSQWNGLLARYTAGTHASAFIFSDEGVQLAGKSVSLPAVLLDAIRHQPPFQSAGSHLRTTILPPIFSKPRPPLAPLLFVVRTRDPKRYWIGVQFHMHGLVPGNLTSAHGPWTLVWMSPSLLTNPFFFDYRPWLAVIVAVILVSALCWLPLIRGLTQSISKITSVTAAIAEGKLETRVRIKRRDELGQLSEAVNHMAERLAGFVNGQRRFLGDIAHELCSPIARIQVALGILDQRAQGDQQGYVRDLREEVEHMSGLIGELLLFSKAGMNSSSAPLTRVDVAGTVARVLERETSNGVVIKTQVDQRLEVMAQPDLLFRALANVVRNAIRYAGDAGPIVISASDASNEASVTV